jgi:hypothetical protein
MVRAPADVLRWIAANGEAPHAGQYEILRSDAQYKLAVCGGGFGKSWTASKIAESYALTGNRSWEISTTYDLSDRIFDGCWDTFAGRGWIRRPGSSRGDRKILLPGGGIIEGKSADHPDSLIGQTLDHGDFDEAATYGGDIFWGKVFPRIARAHGTAFVITTPRGRRNWIFRLYQSILQGHREKSPAWMRWAVWKLPSWVNDIAFPGGRNDPEILAAEQRYRDAGMDGLFEQEFGAEFVTLHGRVYKRWSEANNVVDHAVAERGIRDWYLGIDWGHRNPCAMLVIGRTHEGDWRVVEEFYERGRTPAEILAAVVEIRSRYPITTIYYDPEDPGQGAGVRSAMPRGVAVQAAWNDTDPGRLAVATQIGRKGGLLVSRNCKNLIDEIEDYHYPEESERRETESPVKVHDHACDALRYVIATATRGEQSHVRPARHA